MRVTLVFLAFVTIDWLWARYIVAASDRRALAAAGYSGTIVMAGGFATIAYVDSPLLLIPATLGALVGTYMAVRRG